MKRSLSLVVRFATDDVVIHLAGPGTGKTHAAMQEITESLKEYRPEEIAFVTFTRKGVSTGVERALRVNRDFTPEDVRYFRTLHSLCYHEAGLGKNNMLTSYDLADFNKAFGFRVTGSDSFGMSTEDDKLLERYNAIRSGAKSGIFLSMAYDIDRYERLINAYEAFKQGHGLVDFHDCLEIYLEKGKPLEGVKVFLVDECQDLSPLQWKCVMKLSANAEKVRCFGDDLQVLFSYIGSDASILVEMASHYPTVKHEISYRLPQAVYRFSRGITDMVSEKVDKDYRPATDREGFVKRINDRDMLVRMLKKELRDKGPKPGRWMFLFRTNCFIQNMTDMLQAAAIPYHTSAGFCISAQHLDRIARYYKCRKKGACSKEKLDAFMLKYNIKDMTDDFCNSDLIPGKERYYCQEMVDVWGLPMLQEMSKNEPWLLLSTVHRVKGGEADEVALFLDATKIVMDNMMESVDDELRVLYVGSTRSREGLYLVQSKSKYSMESLVENAFL